MTTAVVLFCFQLDCCCQTTWNCHEILLICRPPVFAGVPKRWNAHHSLRRQRVCGAGEWNVSCLYCAACAACVCSVQRTAVVLFCRFSAPPVLLLVPTYVLRYSSTVLYFQNPVCMLPAPISTGGICIRCRPRHTARACVRACVRAYR